MKNAIALIAVAGIAGAASAQNFTLSLVGAPATVAEGAVFTFDVIGDADVGTHMLGGAFTLSSDSALIADMSWDNASWDQFPTDGGYAGSGNYNQVIFGQLVIPNVPPFDVPGAGSEVGGVIGTFTVTLAATGTGVIDFALGSSQPFTLQTVDINTGALYDDSQAGSTLTLNGASVSVVPAPSALALLGLGGLAAGRRRR